MDEDRTRDLDDADDFAPTVDGPSGVWPASSPAPAQPGETIGERYLLIEVLGQGGFGWVFRARDLKLDREVALKLLRLDRGVPTDNLVREGKALARLEHVGIVPVYDAGLIDEVPYLVMGLVDGRPLGERLADGGRIELDESLGFIEQICDALDYAHERGVVHGDIKPANLLVDDAGRVRIVDFGIARFRREPGGVSPGASGTLGYMAPEVIEGRPASPRSDLFAVAATFYEMLAGHRAFQGQTAKEVIESALRHTPEPLERSCRGLPRGITAAVNTALEKDPEHRFSDGQSFIAALRRARRSRILRYAAAALVAAALLGGSIGSIVWWNRPLTLDVRLMAEKATASGDFTEVELQDAGVLESGDRFWVAGATPNRHAWLYVWLLDSSGQLSQLFPADGIDVALPLQGGQSYEIPPNMRWALDYRTGAETVFVVASRQPVPVPELDALVAQVNAPGEMIASSAGSQTRGVEGLVDPASRRASLEKSVETLLRERFPVLNRLSVRHD